MIPITGKQYNAVRAIIRECKRFGNSRSGKEQPKLMVVKYMAHAMEKI